MEERIEILKKFLNIFWLRPENAFWVTRRSLLLRRYPFIPPVIDISCGDGLFTFTHLGGELSVDFDMFVDVAHLNKVRTENADIFNSYHENAYAPEITKPPLQKIDYGTDWKQSLLNKASKLNLYQNLVLHDNNYKMPFEDDSFMTVYSNSVYWVSNLEFHLKDIWRIVKPEGQVLLEIKVDKLREYTLGHYAPFLGEKLARIIDRGRLETWKGLKNFQWWIDTLTQIGFEIIECKGFIGKIHAIVWNIGLRPLAPVLIKMANTLSKEQRRIIKEEWIEYCIGLLSPLVNLEPFSEEECVEFLFVLKKRV